MAQCKNCRICRKNSCDIYKGIDTNNDVDSFSNYTGLGKNSFGKYNNTRRNGGQRPSNSPKGFFD